MAAPFWGDSELGYDGPDYAENEWDLLWLDKQRVPGISSVNCPVKEKLDKQKKNGTDGGPILGRGLQLARVDITVLLWTPSQWAIWQSLRDRIWRQPMKPDPKDIPSSKKGRGEAFIVFAGAIEISHPALPREVTHVRIEEIGSPVDGPQEGTKVIHIVAVQYIPPANVVTARKIEGKAPLAKEIVAAKNAPARKPSETEAVPVLPAPPEQGSR